MSQRYDNRTTTFTPDGKIQQIEYAIDALKNTGSAVGLITKGGIVLMSERQDVSFLLEQSIHSQKITSINKHIYTVVSGMVADANYLIDQCRIIGLQYKYTYGENIPLEQLIVRICDIKQYITQVGGTRPYGVGFLMAGYDKNLGYQMYTTDPAGAYNIWKAHAMGNNQKAADSVLKQDYKEDLDLSQGLDLALKALIKTMDTTSPAPNKIEIMTIVKDEETGEVKGQTFSEDDVLALLKKNGNFSEKPKQ